jgi:uncharacterized RDD family membrane protein YckC
MQTPTDTERPNWMGQSQWQQPVEAGPAPGWKYGGFWIRFLAYLIDQLIIFLVLVVAYVIFGQGREIREWDDASAGLFGLVALVVFILYRPIFWAWRGRTPGMMPLGLQVRRMDGSRIGLGRAFLRFLGFIIAAIPFYLGLIWAGFDSRKQGWHDKMADTVVVRPG